MKAHVLCITADLQLSPKEEDRWTRYRFLHEPGKAPKESEGGLWLESAIVVFGKPNQYQVGKRYTLELSLTEA